MTAHQLESALLVARIDGVGIAFPVAAVDTIVRAVALSALPGAPPVVEGAVNVRGVVLPVLDLRARLGFPAKAVAPSDFLVLLQLQSRRVAVRVDALEELEHMDDEAITRGATLSPALRHLRGVAARPDGAIVIYDPSAFLSQAEDEAIGDALAMTR